MGSRREYDEPEVAGVLGKAGGAFSEPQPPCGEDGGRNPLKQALCQGEHDKRRSPQVAIAHRIRLHAPTESHEKRRYDFANNNPPPCKSDTACASTMLPRRPR